MKGVKIKSEEDNSGKSVMKMGGKMKGNGSGKGKSGKGKGKC